MIQSNARGQSQRKKQKNNNKKRKKLREQQTVDCFISKNLKLTKLEFKLYSGTVDY